MNDSHLHIKYIVAIWGTSDWDELSNMSAMIILDNELTDDQFSEVMDEIVKQRKEIDPERFKSLTA